MFLSFKASELTRPAQSNIMEQDEDRIFKMSANSNSLVRL